MSPDAEPSRSPSGTGDTAPRHPMAVAADRTGLSSHVLRAWEDRYGAVEPARTDGGHRLYTDAEIHRLRLLRLLTERGRRISRIADMDTGELEALAAEDRREERRARQLLGLPPDEPSDGDDAWEERKTRAMASVEAMDAAGLADLLRRTSLERPATEMIQQLALPLLREIGDRWHDGRLTVAHEHVASGVIRRSLHWILDAARGVDDAPLVVLATLAGERHEGGALAAAAVARSEGWDVLYLGAELSAEEIAASSAESGARIVGISMIRPDGEQTMREIEALRAALPDRVELVLGGPGGAGFDGTAASGSGVRWLADLAGWSAALREMHPQPEPAA